jgi:inner membrane protein involved in colicin E2 resistance
LRTATTTEQKERADVKILPTGIEEQIDRVDRTRSLIIGISSGLIALWCLYRVLWSIYLMTTYSFMFGSLAFAIVLWGVIGVVAAIAATGFLTRYARKP